jgi:cysteinyl-tRNA synthetase
VTLRLYDTAGRTVRDFTSLVEGKVTLYLCGATVQAAPHIGHLRPAVVFDILTRWLTATGYQVTLCRNVTDIDDKIINVARGEGAPWWLVAERNQRAFGRAYDAVGCLPPAVEPRATGHIPEMISLIRRLVDDGHAYPARPAGTGAPAGTETATGDVYFDVGSYPDYGALSGQRLEQMRPAGDTDTAAAKHDPRDFALWKGAKPGEPSWETPWGLGRPGWHLECSAMATKYLGETFDIHGGGLDLVFPHHENELAQSRAAGDGFARFWMHVGLVTTAGEKMSKSLGNSLLVSEVLRRARPQELRYYLGQAHYRSVLEFSEEALAEAAAAYRRIEGFVTRAAEIIGAGAGAGQDGSSGSSGSDGSDGPAGAAGSATTAVHPPGAVDPLAPAAELLGALPPEFGAALDDDLAVPQALALVHDAVREGNNALAAGDVATVRRQLTAVRAMLGVLGLDPMSAPWAGGAARGRDGDLRSVIDALVSVALDQRQAARARRDYAAADAIRDSLRDAGVIVEDTPHGPRWELKP